MIPEASAKNLLQKLAGFVRSQTGRLWSDPQKAGRPAVGVFGKHPGWPDHINLPLVTPALQEVRSDLYTVGFQSIIQTGLWSQVPESDVIPFGHLFCAGQHRSWVIGRLWASADKIGRRDYPMVACIDFPEASIAQSMAFAEPILRDLESACRKGKTSTEVLWSLEVAKSKLSDWKVFSMTVAGNDESAVSAIEKCSDLKAVVQPLLRVLSAWEPLLSRGISQLIFSHPQPAPAAVVRVPRCAVTVESALVLWARFCAEIAGDRHPVFLAAPVEESWVDLMLGMPRPAELAVVRKSANAYPSIFQQPVTQYSNAFLQWANAKLNQAKNFTE